MGQRLPGGLDNGAELVEGTVRRTAGPWTASVHSLLSHLAATGFSGAPRPIGFDQQGREMLAYIDGQTVGSARPWPTWVHSDAALEQVADWLRGYHVAVADFVPAEDAVWRHGSIWRPGLIIAHGDAAPYNAVWNASGLTGFVDWDMAGPLTAEADLAWSAFSWVPLHSRTVVAAEGFSAFDQRRSRLERFLSSYGWQGSTGEVIDLVATRIEAQMAVMREKAMAGDRTYERMLENGVDANLQAALDELGDV